MRCAAIFSAGALLCASLVSAVEYVTINGTELISEATGKRFPIIGVDYQPGGSSTFSNKADPLSDPKACLRDAILLQQLGVNTIRVYNLSPGLDHDQCVSIFNAAGIYMIIDVNSGLYGQYIDRTHPASTYTLEYLEHVFAIVDAFSQYPNLLGFFAANEIINQDSSKEAPLYIRAVVRDLKDYIAQHAPRAIGVGYSAADVSDLLVDTWNYLGCSLEKSPSSKIDFFGLNDYEWCGDSSFTKSGYNKLVEMFSNTDIPVFFSEYGCNNVKPRTFSNVPVLYGEQMSLLSGGLVYEYSQETNDYGLVNIKNPDKATLLIDYDNLKKEFAKLDETELTFVNKTGVTAPTTTCAASLVTGSGTYNSWDLPSRPSGADALISKGVSSANKGSIVSVTATTMPAAVYNYNGDKVSSMSLVSLGCKDSNWPGLVESYTATSQSCSYATAAGGSSSGSDGHHKSGAAAMKIDGTIITIASVVLAMFLGGFMAI